MTKTLHGKIHGRTIELDEDIGLTEGQEVEVSVRMIPLHAIRVPGDGILRTEGSLSDDPYWDEIMDEIQRSRKQERHVLELEP